jgi:pimeloyl-ACP methyl ester carboxylesterase
MLHGLLAAGETFDLVIAGLRDDQHILALDMPGNGESDRPLELDATFHGLAEIVREFIRQLGLARPVLVGHSHGGTVGLRIAASDPQLLSGLVLICPAHPFAGYSRRVVRFYLSLPGRALAHFLPYIPRSVYLWTFRRVPGSREGFGYPELEPYLHTLRRPGTIPYTLRLLSSWEADMQVLADDMQREPVGVPVLLLWGAEDNVVPVGSAQALVPHLQAARMVALSGVGHLPNEEVPEECARLIGEWMRDVAGSDLA